MTKAWTWRSGLLICAALAAPGIVAGAGRPAPSSRPSVGGVRIAGSWSGYHVCEDLAKAFRRTTGMGAGVTGRPNQTGFAMLAEGKTDVLVYSPVTEKDHREAMEKAFPKGRPQPVEYCVGSFVVHVVVNGKRHVAGLTVEQIGQVLAGRISDWRDLGYGEGRIRVFAESSDSKSEEILRARTLQGLPPTRSLRRLERPDLVATEVAKDVDAIGFYLDRRYDLPDVSIVAVQAEGRKLPCLPTAEAVLEGRYPLMEDLLLYRRPDSGDAAKAYCEFATSHLAEEAVRARYLYSHSERAAYLSAKRLSEHKAGKGPVVRAAGPGDCRKMMEEMERAYILACGELQLQYAPVSDEVAVVGSLVLGEADLALLGGPPSGRALEIHGQKWRDLWKETKGKPAEYALPGRAVAIVVNRANPVETVTTRQLGDLYSGKIKSWKTLAAGLTGTDADNAVQLYGLAAGQPAATIFTARVLGASPCGPVAREFESQAVLAKLATDPNGIAFIDAVAIPEDPDKAGIRVLTVAQGGSAVPLTAANVMAGSYPLSSRTCLYARPDANEAAKRFADFLSKGGRVGNRFDGTTGPVADILRKQGFVAEAVNAPTSRKSIPGERTLQNGRHDGSLDVPKP